MQVAVYVVISCLIGGVLGYLLARFYFSAAFVSKQVVATLQQKIGELEQLNAAKLSRDEINREFDPKAVNELLQLNLQQLKEQLKDEAWVNLQSREEILKLTRESEQKVSKKELEERNAVILDLNNNITTLKQKEEHLNEKLGSFTKEMERLHQFSQERFNTLATEILEEKKNIFVVENKKELNSILDPLKIDLNQFKEKVDATRKEDIRDLTSLKKEIEALQKLNVQLSDDAKNLASALKSEVKMQGSWGEDRLNMILELEGLHKYIDYSREEMYQDATEEKNRRPDFILKLPNGKHIVIDSKVSLTAYVNYFNATDATEKMSYLKQHLRSVADHIEKLADKNYQSLAGLSTPDYVFLFMPVESALTLAMNQSPEIFNNALKRNIVLITPTTLVATLKIIKIIWQKENQVKNVEEIFRQCGELYNKFVVFLEEMDRVEGALSQASRAHREAMNHLKDGTRKSHTIIGRFEKIKDLEAKTNKQIPDKFLKELDILPDDGDELKALQGS